MENRRSLGSGFFGVEKLFGTPNPLFFTAALSVGVLVVVVAWSATRHVVLPTIASTAVPSASLQNGTDTGNPAFTLTESSTTPFDLSTFAPQVVGVLASEYTAMQQQGAYTAQSGAQAAASIASSVKAPISYRTFSSADITTTPDASYARMQQYQKDLRAAMAPLSQNQTPELTIFAAYVQTGDTTYLDQLRTLAQGYDDATAAMTKVITPQDALQDQINMLNAMSAYGATLQALADNAQDPITTMALVNTYQTVQANLVNALDTFASYVQNHPKP